MPPTIPDGSVAASFAELCVCIRHQHCKMPLLLNLATLVQRTTAGGVGATVGCAGASVRATAAVSLFKVSSELVRPSKNRLHHKAGVLVSGRGVLQVSGPGWSECALQGFAHKPKRGDAMMFYRCAGGSRSHNDLAYIKSVAAAVEYMCKDAASGLDACVSNAPALAAYVQLLQPISAPVQSRCTSSACAAAAVLFQQLDARWQS